MDRSRLIATLYACAFVFVVTPSYAATVTWKFSGTISSVFDYAAAGAIVSIQAGNSFGGVISFDNSTAGTPSSVPGGVKTDYLDAITAMTLSVGAFNFTGPTGSTAFGTLPPGSSSQISIFQDAQMAAQDRLDYRAVMAGHVDGLSSDLVDIILDGASLTSGNLPDVPPVSQIDFVMFFKNGLGEITSQLNGTGTISAVPVPAALWLFGSGLIGLIGIARVRAA